MSLYRYNPLLVEQTQPVAQTALVQAEALEAVAAIAEIVLESEQTSAAPVEVAKPSGIPTQLLRRGRPLPQPVDVDDEDEVAVMTALLAA